MLKASADRLPFPSASFDKVYCSEVLEHVLDPRAVVAEMARVVKPAGTVVISIPHEKLIDFVKGLLLKVGIFHRMLNNRKGYGSVPEKMTDEWHLHQFGLPLLHKTVAGIVTIEKLSGAPARFFPLRYVARCRVVQPQ